MAVSERSQPIRLGVVGLGRGFVLTLPALRQHPEIHLVAAADPRKAAQDRFFADFAAPAYSTTEELLDDPAVEAVYIASPHEFHAAQTIAAAKKGKHVLVEKPMATTLSDCVSMVSAAAASGTVLVVGPSHGFDAPVAFASELLSRGTLGRVRLITAINFTDFLYRPRRPEELDTTRGGGVVYSQAAHQLDVVRRLAGSRVVSIRATTGVWDAARPTEGAYCAHVDFESGTAATLTYSGYGRYDSDELIGWVSEVGRPKDPDQYGFARRRLGALGHSTELDAKLARAYGEASTDEDSPAPYHEHFGFVLASCERGDVRLTASGIWVYGEDDRRFLPIAPPRYPRAEVVDEFVAAVRGRRRPIHDGQWGAATVACCEALLRSSSARQEISIP